jgi:medium-chain acyl-[acyl-carrier-protein] hydrolase
VTSPLLRHSHPWFPLAFSKPSASLRLFCLPYAGGGASVFVPWAKALRDSPIEICGLQLPGREQRMNEAPFFHLDPLIDALAAAIQPLLDRPYAFFGHSMGATLAFELTRELRRLGQPRLPHHLFVSGAEAPDVPDEQAPLAGIEEDDAFVLAVARRYGGVPQIVLENAELRSLIVPALRGDLTLHETYRYREGAPLPIAMTAYGGRGDEMVSEASLQRWARHTSGTFACRFFDGGHFFLNDVRDELIGDVTARLPGATGN